MMIIEGFNAADLPPSVALLDVMGGLPCWPFALCASRDLRGYETKLIIIALP